MPNAIYVAIERILSPLARLLVGHGVSFGQVSEMLKAAMVREALARAESEPDNAQRGGAQRTTPSDSRLSIATGIHRKDVKRLRETPGGSGEALEGSTAAQVLAKWLSLNDPPPLLSRKVAPEVKPGQNPSFDTLVESISKDIRPRAVLDELLARAVVTEEGNNLLRVHADRLVLNQDLAGMAEYLGMNIHDHLSAAVHNLAQEGSPQLDQCVHYHGLSERVVDDLHALARTQTMQALTTVNNAAQQLIKEKKNRGSYRFNFGAYFRKEAMK